MMRFELGDGISLETARDCHGQPRLLRIDDSKRLPVTVDLALRSLAAPVALSPHFYWVDVPQKFRAYHVNESTVRFVFRQRAAGLDAIAALDLVRIAYESAGRLVRNFLPSDLKELFHQWDNEPISC
jgi:hypothetical protein